MDREAFEQLVSEWLDQPGRDDLRARIEAAAAESPPLARLRDQWLRLDRLVRSAGARADGVDWCRLQQRIVAQLEPGATDAGLDQRLRKLTAVEQRVDWPRLRRRISQAAAGPRRGPIVIRFPLRRVGARLALLGAAAALVFMFTLPVKSPIRPAGFAQVHVSAPAGALGSRDRGSAFARVTVSPPADADDAVGVARPSQPGPEPVQLAEVFLMIEPVRVTAETAGSLIPLHFN